MPSYEKDRILLYIDKGFEANSQYATMLALLQQQINVSGLQLQPMPLVNNQNKQAVLLVACINIEHAISLSNKYELGKQQVFWLQESPKGQVQNHLLPGHWFLDWSNEQALLPLLHLLQRQYEIEFSTLRTEQKLAMLTECLGEHSLILDANGKITELSSELSGLINNSSASAIGQELLSCLHIPSPIAKTRMHQILSNLKQSQAITRLPPFPIQLASSVIIVDGLVGPIHKHETLVILRQVATWQSQEWIEQLAVNNSPLTLLLINPDDFSHFNQQYGREQSDQVLNEIMQSMSDLLRTADFVSRYSGAVFAAHLPDTNEQQGKALARRMQQTLRKKLFTKRKVKLKFSLGLATIDSEEKLGEQSPVELFSRANTALQAARNNGGGNLVSWQAQFDGNINTNLDCVTGKFTDAPVNDFQLITLQWDLIRLIGSTHSLQTFSDKICHILASGMQCEFAGLYICKNETLSCLSSHSIDSELDQKNVHQWVNSNIQVDKLLNSSHAPVEQMHSCCQVILPLITRGHCLGVLLFRWPLTLQAIASKFSSQVQHMIPNIAAAIDRIRLLENDRRRREMVDNKQVIQHELLFESAAMRTLMQQVQLVAPTDASVLIIGESGTGKEIIARQIHNYSMLPEKPFITVDCSTIVEHLIESELFGHRKGAFTGATSDQPGMIAQADGGTLFLDEIGELPLDIQSKLLRFVQEKTYVAVGDQRVRKVDVRLVLATNRNLLDEVAAKRFRSDLFYRINVFTVTLPPLRQRGNDVLLLCRHFLAKYSKQYSKDICDFTPAAMHALQHYSWPGNVRELRNSMMRAVILCDRRLVDCEHLILQEQENVKVRGGFELKAIQAHKVEGEGEGAAGEKQSLKEVTSILRKLVKFALQQSRLFPVSVWVEMQWLNLCLDKWGSIYQVAQQLDRSESTLRRRYAKLNRINFNFPQLIELENEFKTLLESFLETAMSTHLWSSIETKVQESVLSQEISQQDKAQLLDVTQPTLRKIMQQKQGQSRSYSDN